MEWTLSGEKLWVCPKQLPSIESLQFEYDTPNENLSTLKAIYMMLSNVEFMKHFKHKLIKEV